MLINCKIQGFDADESGWAFLPRPAYVWWLKTHEDIKSIRVTGIPPLRVSGAIGDRGQNTVGIRRYKIDIEVEWQTDSDWPRFESGFYLISLVKGIDGKIRILGIGNG